MNQCFFLQEALTECYALGYDEQPNYAKLKFILKKCLLKIDLVPGGKYFKNEFYGENENNEENQELEEVPEDEAIRSLNQPIIDPSKTKVNLERLSNQVQEN